MPQIRRFFSRLLTFFRTGKADTDLSREINGHLRLLEDEFVAKGMTSEDARYAARRAFGGIDQAKEHHRDARTFAWLDGWSVDLKLGARMLVKTPGLTIVAVIALAVGIAAGGAYFEFVNDLLRPKLSFAGADRLVGFLNWDLTQGSVERRSLYEFAAWKTQLTTVEGLGAARPIEENLVAGDGRSQPSRGWEISAAAFRAVPIPPLYGRPLLDDDEKNGATDVVVIGEDLWKARFNSDPQVVGRTVRFGETLRTIVGVMPHSFGFPDSGTLWTPMRLDTATARRAEGPAISIFGRLAPGANLDQAQAQLSTIAERMGGMTRPRIYPYVEAFWAVLGPALWLFYAVNIVFIALLGICAANVAQLIFARTAARESEITVRTALGASRRRIVGQFVAEALVLASIAGVVGLAGASFALRRVGEMLVLIARNSGGAPFWWDGGIGIETVAYSALLVIIAALLIGCVPALKATGSQMNARLKEAGGGATMRFGKLWTGVMVAQVALTVMFVLVFVSAVWLVYQQNRRADDVAFSRSEYLIGSIRLEAGATAERMNTVRRELLRRLNEDLEVINATYAADMPGDVDLNEFRLELPSKVVVRGAPAGVNYFETFQQPLVAGRLFTPVEIEEHRNVVIVDETFVRLVLGGRSAVGQLVRESGTESWLEIVGVVKDITLGANKKAADAVLYQPETPNGRIVVHSRSNDVAASPTFAPEVIELGFLWRIMCE